MDSRILQDYPVGSVMYYVKNVRVGRSVRESQSQSGRHFTASRPTGLKSRVTVVVGVYESGSGGLK